MSARSYHPPDRHRPPDRLHSVTLFESELVTFGRFDAKPHDPDFATAGRIGRRHEIVFPRTSVAISQAGRRTFITDPNMVVLYNRRQEYSRRKVAEEGDRCCWIAYRDDVLVEALRLYDPSASQRRDALFTHGWVLADSAAYLLHHLSARHTLDSEALDVLAVEETLLHVLSRIAARLPEERSRRSTPPGRRSIALAEEVKGFLALNFAAAATLDDIASRFGVSPFYLARCFRAATGASVHNYRNDSRLRRALERIPDHRGELDRLALDLGFSSHSHFTAAFRSRFGIRPSDLHGKLSSPTLRELLARLPL